MNYRYIGAALQECSTKQSSQLSTHVPVVDSLRPTSKTDETRISHGGLPHRSQLSQVEAPCSEKVVKKLRAEEMQVERKSSIVDENLEEAASNKCPRCEGEAFALQAGPEVIENRVSTCTDRTALGTQTVEDDLSFTEFLQGSQEEDNVSLSQKTFKRRLCDDTDCQSQSHHGEPVNLTSNFILPVKCQGAMYKTNRHTTESGDWESSLQGGSNMPRVRG